MANVVNTARVIQLEQAMGAPGPEVVRHPSRQDFVASRPRGRRFQRAVAWLEAQALFVAGAAAVAAFSVAKIPQHLNQDGWLALVGGRYVAGHGIPSSDTLTVLGHGTRWVDQQWLAQLILYRLEQLGGLKLYAVLYVVLTLAGLLLAIAAARSLGGSEGTILWVLPGAGFLYFAGSFQIRTQGFAYALFVAVLWLLAQEVRAPSRRRVYLVFPLLVLWANLHGSVTMGVGLALLYGIMLLVHDLQRGGLRGIRRRTGSFLLGPGFCLLLTPYGLTIVSYYRDTLLNPTFSKVVTEWQPITSIMVVAVPFLLLACATIWLLGRSGRRTNLFDQVALIALAFGALYAVRNVTWFGLAAAMLLPAVIRNVIADRAPAPRRRTLNLAIVATALLVVTTSLAAVLARPASWFERGYDMRTASAVAAVVHQQPTAHVFADIRFADWLLWQNSALAGKVAYDARFELLSRRQILSLADLSPTARLIGSYRVLVLDPANGFTKAVLASPHVRVVSRTARGIVALNTGA
jgi:hypothetical protein